MLHNLSQSSTLSNGLPIRHKAYMTSKYQNMTNYAFLFIFGAIIFSDSHWTKRLVGTKLFRTLQYVYQINLECGEL